MKKKFKKPGLSLETDEQPDPLAQSTYSRIDHEGLKFIKDDIKVSKEGLSKISGGEELNKYLAVKKEDLDFGDLLGVGAAGQVQQAIYKPLDEPVAVKNINIYDQAKRHQLMNDIRLLLQIKSKSELEYQSYCPFIVKMFGAFYDEGSVKVVLELMDCGSLLDALNKLRVSKAEGPYFEEPVLAKITQQILNGLMFLHVVSHQMHRDIKPANILINSKGEVKLTDFGIGKELDETDQFASTFRGTQTYMSPERLDGLPYNHVGDIWSVGVMLIELATGKYPYPHGNFIEMREYINNKPTPKLPSGGSYSAEFQDFIEQTLTKNYKKRPSAIELMRHPWILKNNQLEVDLEEWVKVNNLKNKSKVKKMEVIQEGDQEF